MLSVQRLGDNGCSVIKVIKVFKLAGGNRFPCMVLARPERFGGACLKKFNNGLAGKLG